MTTQRRDKFGYLVDRRLLHSSDVWLGVLAITVGGLLVLAPIITGQPATRALTGVAQWLPLFLSTMMAVGGLLSLAGLLPSWRIVSIAWTLEQAGALMAGGAWAGYAYALAVSPGGSIAGAAITWILAAAHITRALVVFLVERRTRKATGCDEGTT